MNNQISEANQGNLIKACKYLFKKNCKIGGML